MTMFERLERLEQRIGALEASKVELGPLEHRDLVALDRHFDGRCDYLSKRVDELVEHLESVKESLETAHGHIEALETAHAAQTPRLAVSTDDGLKPMKEDPFVARLLEVGTPRYVRDTEFREACDLLKNWLWQHMYGGRTPDAETDAFLARARVATEEP